MTAMRRVIEVGGYVLGLALLVYAWLELVPAGTVNDPLNPAGFATIAALFAVGAAITLRSLGRDRQRLEALFLALVLGFMPLIYLAAAIMHGDVAEIAIECAGLLIFGGIAVLGFRRGTWIIAAGIIAHGVIWDGWRHGGAPYIEDWYPLGCLAFDLGFGLMVLGHAVGTRRREADQISRY